MERTFYLAKDKKEYPNLEDATKYGGGAVAVRKEVPVVDTWEHIALEEAPQEEEQDIEIPSTEREELIAKAKEAGIKNPRVCKTETLKEKLAQLGL